MSRESFFNEPRQQSLVKAEIVSQYFWAWAKVIIPTIKRIGQNKIAYVDLFAGAGRYDTGEPSTPLLILQKAIEEPDFCEMLTTAFNDINPSHAKALQEEIDRLPHIDRLANKPLVHNIEVNKKLAQQIANRKNRPSTLTFLDPCGYKGLSVQLIEAVVKHQGCECIFFFNYNRVNPALNNEGVSERMDELFGEKRATLLRHELQNQTSSAREEIIIRALRRMLRKNNKLVSMFRFTTPTGQRTSHYLVFVTKHPKGYEIMKDIMAKHSSQAIQGVASFEFNPHLERQPMLLELSTPIDDLGEDLLREFAGQTLTMQEIYVTHHLGQPYRKPNYKQALLKLERMGQIRAEPAKRQKDTFGDGVRVIFPSS